MGLLFCRLLPHYTRAAIVAGGRNPQRLAIARGYGLEQVFDVEEKSLKDQLEGDRSADCVIECTGQIDGWHAALNAVQAGGQTLLFGGLPQGTVLEIDTFQLHYQETRVLGSFHFGPPDVRKAAGLLENSEIRVDDLISGEMGLDDLESALKQMEAGQGIKYAIDPWV
jgi:threonine dehydrogenase-like Zn-dependent dehydrogenase